MGKILDNLLLKKVAIILFVFSLPTSNAFGFDLNKMLNNMPKSGAESGNANQQGSKGQKPVNPFGGIFGGMSAPQSSIGGGSSKSGDKQSGASMAGFVCAGFKTKNSGVLYGSLSSSDLMSEQQLVAADLKLSLNDAKRLLQDQFQNMKWSGWVTHFKADYESSFLDKKVKATFIEYTNKDELRLEMAARLKKALNDPSVKKRPKAEAAFAYSLILARYEHFHKNSNLINSLLDNAYSASNVGASYVKALRMYNGYGLQRDVNGAGNFSALAVRRVNELNEDAERLGTPKLSWNAPSDLQTLNLTDPEFKDHKRYQNMAAQGNQMRQSIEASFKSNKLPAVRREAELLASSFDEAADELAEIYGISGKVAAERLKFQTLKSKADEGQQVLETKIAMRKATADAIEEAIAKSDAGLQKEAEEKAKKIRSQFDGLASRSFSLMINAGMNFSISDDLAFAMKTADRMRTDGCRFVSAMDGYFERSNVEFTAEEKKTMGGQAVTNLKKKVPKDDEG